MRIVSPKEVNVGDPATIYLFSDCHAATVIEVSESRHKVVVQHDHAKRVDTNGMSDQQEYVYERNPAGRKLLFKWSSRKNTWIAQGCRLEVGSRREYWDPTF